MVRRPNERSPRSEEVDPLGMDEASQSFWGRSFGLVLPAGFQSLVPTPIARLGLDISVTTTRTTISPGQSTDIEIELRNRLPAQIALPLEGKQHWGWTVDGFEAAREEPRRRSDVRSELSLDGWERRTFVRTWDGTFRKASDPPRWVDADPGTYEIEAYVPLDRGTARDVTTIEVVGRR